VLPIKSPLNPILDESDIHPNNCTYNFSSDSDELVFNEEQHILNSLAKWKVNVFITYVFQLY
jgi:hypothetical protein